MRKLKASVYKQRELQEKIKDGSITETEKFEYIEVFFDNAPPPTAQDRMVAQMFFIIQLEVVRRKAAGDRPLEKMSIDEICSFAHRQIGGSEDA